MPDPQAPVPRDADGRPIIQGAESTIAVPEGGFGDTATADHSDMADGARRMENRSFPEERADHATAAEDDVEAAAAAAEPSVDQTTGQSFGAG